jgi:membrane fusion protein (multidrug efflux system)
MNKHRITHFVIIITSYLLFSLPVLAQPPRAMPVEAASVKLDTVSDEVTAVGSLLPEENVMIRSELAGRILTIHFSEGQQVQAHQTLITIDAAEYEAILAEDEATVKLNQLNFERTKDLVAKNLTSRQNFDEMRTKLEQSLAHQKLDQVRLEKTKILAPFTGILGLRNISRGAYLQVGQELVTLVNTSTVKLDFRIPEKYLSKIQMGQTVTVRVDAYPTQDFTGEVYALEPTVDEGTRTILLRARIPNPDRILLSGMFARISLVLEKRQNAILVPEQAIVPLREDTFVFKIVNGKAMMTKVTLGQRRTGDVEVLHGLSVTDKIVISGQLKLRDGVEVMIAGTGKPSLPGKSPEGPPPVKQ